MKRLLILLVAFLLCTQPTYAGEPFEEEDDEEAIFVEEPSYVRYKLPTVETNRNGEKCLNTEQWKEVLQVASEYKRHFEWRLEIEPVLLEYRVMELAYMELSDGYVTQIEYLEKERDGLRLYIQEQDNLKLKLQKHHRIEKGFMWALIAIETLAIGFLGIRSAAVN